MDEASKRAIAKIELQLKSLAYTDAERNHIIDLANQQYELTYSKTDKKFLKRYLNFGGLGVAGFAPSYVIELHEEKDYYAM